MKVNPSNPIQILMMFSSELNFILTMLLPLCLPKQISVNKHINISAYLVIFQAYTLCKTTVNNEM